jgi:hypothetical protein
MFRKIFDFKGNDVSNFKTLNNEEVMVYVSRNIFKVVKCRKLWWANLVALPVKKSSASTLAIIYMPPIRYYKRQETSMIENNIQEFRILGGTYIYY